MKGWYWWMIGGVLSLIGGFIALANPFAASITAELLAGWSFIMVGIVTLISAFGEGLSGGRRVVNSLLGILILFLGIQLIANPLGGLVSLTLAVAWLLIFVGIMRIVVAFTSLQGGFRWAMVISGVISLILSGMIFTNFPQSALAVLGIFLAVELISNGLSLIALSLARKNGVTTAAMA